ncbi:MAG: hypothetical protein A2Z91_07215 [Deltaproteobacteria bacterium GWA2_38_16]|nr:MAG: hypothetical protein A2Z91_07215 [Deltaproteobacteria bacterium GWA2_38_16]OGQ02699.1 MAG: hypothetical protein A3D19_00550 [Deltaproteobacteria bacterium RIFCSPHIGHO2_02_FULL_38_15]OGQ59043.1 MAG: hypothetical protein A3G92_05080 [Deltaproteobacteria bacterium RIFCSPLOWO2_12_FULL_38_8]HBQ20556.1 hypothetical protein [Deltaproteobacteria bacterium]
MKFISFCVNRPIATMMMLSILIFFGLISLWRIPVDLFPNVSHPQLSIVTKFENASSEEIEKNITKPLEEELSFLKNLEYIRSLSQEGESRIELMFRWGTHMDFAALETREKIDLVKSRLPEDANDPILERYNPNAQAILMIHAAGETQSQTENLREICHAQVKPILERILGIAQVKIFGGEEKEIEVALNPHHLKSYGLSSEEVIHALKTSNISSRGGTLREGNIDLLIKTSSKLTSTEDILNTVVGEKNKKLIYLKNLGTAQVISKIKKDHAFLNGEPSVTLALYKEPSGNTLSISKKFLKLKSTLEKESHLKLKVTYDQADIIKDSLSMVKSNALQGALLTILILFIFLKNFSTTFIVAISIPFSVICSFFLLYTNGVTLNIFSLAGIALALGMVVDASIVILENIFEHLSQDIKPKTAAINATIEVGGAVIASTLTTLAVFVPILFVKGPLGIIFKDLSLSIIYGLIFSMIISFSFIPMIAALILKPPSKEKLEDRIDRWKNIVLQGLSILNQVYHLGTKIAKMYEDLLRRFTLTPKELYKKALEQTHMGEKTIEIIQTTVEKQFERTLKEAIQSWKSRVSVIAVVFILFFVSLLFIPKTEFLPEALQNHYELNVHYPPGTSLLATQEGCKAIDTYLRTLPNISQTHLKIVAAQGTFLIYFVKPKKALKTLSDMRHHLRKIPDIHFSVSALSPLNAITSGLETRSLDFKMKGPDIAILKAKSKLFSEEIKKIEGVTAVAISHESSAPEMKVIIDQDKAADMALTSQIIARSLKDQLYGIEATTLSQEGKKDISVVVRSKTGALDTLQKLKDLMIPSPLNIHVPLSSIATFEEVFSPSMLPREEKERTLTLLTSIDSSTAPDTVIQHLPNIKLPSDYSFTIGPQIKLFKKSFSDLKIAIIVAIILIYMVMAAQFESLLHPFTILFSVPLSLIGVTASLVLFREYLSISAYIGIIILAGIAVNNAIVLIDYINILRRRGIDREEAILQAGKRRLRPILMTSLTTIFGMIPMALGIGSGAELYQPLAIVMVGGMISSTLLTLLFIPTIYCFFDDLGDILGFGLLKLQVLWQKKSSSPL